MDNLALMHESVPYNAWSTTICSGIDYIDLYLIAHVLAAPTSGAIVSDILHPSIISQFARNYIFEKHKTV